jgi:hypothetical protein
VRARWRTEISARVEDRPQGARPVRIAAQDPASRPVDARFLCKASIKLTMAPPSEGDGSTVSKRRRRVLAIIVAAIIVVGVLLALVFVPYNSVSKEVQVSTGTGATTALTFPEAGWVTVHFDHPYRMGMSMHYWMQGSGGMMFDHSMMGGSDSYSFWSWGGTYQCGAGYAGFGSGTMPVWVNATWGMI